MLQYTGHPLYDVGVATLAAFVGKRDPALLTEEDLSVAADYTACEYVRQPLKSFLTVAFPNSGFTNPAFEGSPERRQAYAERVLRSYTSETPTMPGLDCVFTGNPAVGVVLKDSDGLPPGRTYRQHVPLLTGEAVINFYPYGEAGLPVSGRALLAMQAFPLGCAKCGGRLLAVHSDNGDIIWHFAARFLEQNRRSIQLAHQSDSTKMPESHRSQRTLLIETLLEADAMRGDAVKDDAPFAVTAYHLTNSGQGADLAIYHLPLQTVGFLRLMHSGTYRDAWSEIVHRAWEVAPKPSARGKKAATEAFEPRRNWLYEDLFALPGNARAFLRTYFLRTAIRYARGESDPRGAYSLREEAHLVSWQITEPFLRRIMGMEKERIEQIRDLGDRLADYVATENDRRLFRDFYTEQRYSYFRATLLKANVAAVRHGREPLLALDPYVSIFEEGDEVSAPDWRLARDLVLIRMVEQLYQQGWLGRNVEAIPETTPDETETAQ